jgi:hypothetical protein
LESINIAFYTVQNSVKTKAQADMVVKKLKRYFPGFVSMVYALPLSQGWTTPVSSSTCQYGTASVPKYYSRSFGRPF